MHTFQKHKNKQEAFDILVNRLLDLAYATSFLGSLDKIMLSQPMIGETNIKFKLEYDWKKVEKPTLWQFEY